MPNFVRHSFGENPLTSTSSATPGKFIYVSGLYQLYGLTSNKYHRFVGFFGCDAHQRGIRIAHGAQNTNYSGPKISDSRKVFLSKYRYEILIEIGGSDEQNEAAVYSRTKNKDCA